MYIQLQKKLPQSLLARYHRWLFENNMTESVVALQTWVLQESHFQTKASETINRLTGQTSNTHLAQSTLNIVGERTFFIRTEACQPQPIQPCQVCRQKHRIWQCKVFKQEDVSERWNIAKRFQLCYRCLAEGHHGKSCQRTRQCGKNGCHKVHHRLLHLHQDTSSRQFLKQNQIPGHAAPTYNMDTRDLKLSPQLTSFSARRGTTYDVRIRTLWAHTLTAVK